MTRWTRFARRPPGDSAAVSLLDRPDAATEDAVPRSHIEALLESGERLLDESRRLLDELNAVDDDTARRFPPVAEQ